MAFKAVQKKITNDLQTLYTTPEGMTTVVFSGTFSNLDEENVAFINLTLTVAEVTTFVLKNIPLPMGSSLVVPKVVVPARAYIQASTDINTASKIDLTLSILES